MYEFGNTILAESLWLKIVHVLTTPSLQLFLLLGSLVLVISLLLLTMTRLGHARPITKCVVLSVIAHVLLLGYAYGTKLIFHVPVAKKEDPIKINLIDDGIEKERIIEPANDELVDDYDSSVVPNDTHQLRRPKTEVPFEMERVVDLPTPDNEFKLSDTKPLVEIANLQNPSPNFNIKAPNIDFQQDEIFEDVQAEETDFQRIGQRPGDVQNHQPDVEVSVKELDRSSELRDVEVEPKILNENAFSDPADRAEQFESELVIPDSDKKIVDEFASSKSSDDSPSYNFSSDSSSQVQRQHRLGDGQPIPPAYLLRAAPNRLEIAGETGGTQKTEDAVQAALQWLASVQKEDGRWAACDHEGGKEDKVFGHDRGGCGSDADTGITALAALSFLGAGHTHLEGKYRVNVQRALEYLIQRQASDGDLSGDAKLFARMYCHSMSLLALSEALAVTGDYRLKQPVNLGLHYTLAAQDRNGGGWRYQPGDTGDMSQFGWKVMAINSAISGGIEIDPTYTTRMVKFLRSCQTGNHDGLASYRPGEGPSTTMTAEALVCKSFMNQPISESSLQESQDRLLKELPSLGRTNLYYWYYGTLALHQSGGQAWQRWNTELQRVLLSQQTNSGSAAGSWAPDGVWGGYGGRVYSTALATMCLEVYYRYQPQNSPVSTSVSVLIPTESGEAVR